MKKLTFRGAMFAASIITGSAALLGVCLYRSFPADWLLSLNITFFTFFYHFAMRLLVGYLVPNRFDHRHRWFQPRPFEHGLYRVLRVKSWKDHMPTFDPARFDLKKNSLLQVIGNMCQAETVHEIIIVCSFIPLLFSIPWGSFLVFLSTSIIAAAIDTVFVIMQRYNRPRLIRLWEKQRTRRYL